MHRDDDAQAEDQREALDERRAEPEEDDAGNNVRDVGVADGEPCAREALADGRLGALALVKLLFDALGDEDVRVDGEAHRQDEARDARRGKHDRHELEEHEHDNDVYKERHYRHQARQAVPEDHEQRKEHEARDAGREARMERLVAERRADGLGRGELDGYGERAQVEVAHHLPRGLGGEIPAAYNGGPVGNGRLDDRGRKELAVEEYGEQAARVGGRYRAKEPGALGIEVDADDRRGRQGALPVAELKRCFGEIRAREARVLEHRCVGGRRDGVHGRVDAFFNELELEDRRLSDELYRLLYIGDAGKLDHQAVGAAAQRPALLRLHQGFSDAECVDASLDDLAQGRKRVRQVGRVELRGVGAVHEARAAREVEPELEVEAPLRARGLPHEHPRRGRGYEDDNRPVP